ncbi:tyrosine-type recombinase/integrase [Streptomyces sp. NPDC002519]
MADLPAEWDGEVLGPGIDGWEERAEQGRGASIKLSGLPYRLRTELAWMAHWQFRDGARVSVGAFNQIAKTLVWAAEHGRTVRSLADLDLTAFCKLHGAWFESQHGRLPGAAKDRLGAIFSYARLALTARLNEGPWWKLDVWYPRCDPRIPLRAREPKASERCSPGQVDIPWLRETIKFCLGTALESGALTWSTVTKRTPCLARFGKWAAALDTPADALSLAPAFRRWTSAPETRPRLAGQPVRPRNVNDELRAVVALMRFVLDNREECQKISGPSPWDDLTELHPAIWTRQITRSPSAPLVNDEHYIDDQALSPITAYLPVIGASTDKKVTVALNGTEKMLKGWGDPQAMRMLLLQILTGRRASEISLCDFDCLSPATDRAIEAAEGEQVARFRYAQSKIDRAPDTILVDAEVVAVIEEQQQWVRDHFPGLEVRYLFLQRAANSNGTKPYGSSNYRRALREFSELIDITDSKGRTVQVSKTHRFRHTRITRLAELGLPVHVLQRYAGHSNPTMSMHYVARREEHSEQAFLATRKFKADGTAVTFSREDHDGMQLFNRADRFLPHGYCLLPPLQSCDKGNACLTCSVFVTDSSHLETLRRQLAETEALIQRQTSAFQARHGRPMPADNVWLVQRNAERDALAKLLTSMQESPGRPCQGAGSPTAGPTPITIDTTRHRRTWP